MIYLHKYLVFVAWRVEWLWLISLYVLSLDISACFINVGDWWNKQFYDKSKEEDAFFFFFF